MQAETRETYGEQAWAATRKAALYITRVVLVSVIAVTMVTAITVIVAEESALRVAATLSVASGEPRVYGLAVAFMLLGGLWGYAYRRPVLGAVAGAAFFIAILLSAAVAA